MAKKEVKPTVTELVAELQVLANECTGDAVKICTGEYGTGTACARVRKAMQLIKKLAQHIRTESQTLKNAKKG